MIEQFIHEPHLPYEVILPKINESHLWTMQQWCNKNFGSRWSPVSRLLEEKSGKWTVFWCGMKNPRDYRWHFATEQDALLFRLRWQN